MARASAVTRAVGLLADATGRTDEEVAVALIVGAATVGFASAVLCMLQLLNYLDEMDVYVVGPPRRRS